jgi:hypothetical protein
VSTVIVGLKELSARFPGWTVDTPASPGGQVVLGAAWICLAVREIIAESKADGGNVLVGIVDPATAAAKARRKPLDSRNARWLEITLHSKGGAVVSIEAIRSGYSNLPLLAAHEMVLQSNGWIESLPAGSQSGVSVGIPIALMDRR